MPHHTWLTPCLLLSPPSRFSNREQTTESIELSPLISTEFPPQKLHPQDNHPRKGSDKGQSGTRLGSTLCDSIFFSRNPNDQQSRRYRLASMLTRTGLARSTSQLWRPRIVWAPPPSKSPLWSEKKQQQQRAPSSFSVCSRLHVWIEIQCTVNKDLPTLRLCGCVYGLRREMKFLRVSLLRDSVVFVGCPP